MGAFKIKERPNVAQTIGPIRVAPKPPPPPGTTDEFEVTLGSDDDDEPGTRTVYITSTSDPFDGEPEFAKIIPGEGCEIKEGPSREDISKIRLTIRVTDGSHEELRTQLTTAPNFFSILIRRTGVNPRIWISCSNKGGNETLKSRYPPAECI